MNILILGDIHGRNFWKNAITQQQQQCSKIIFLGDYLDPYQAFEPITRKESMKILDEIIEFKKENNDKVVLLLGNHDIQYITKTFFTRARYDSSNAWHNNKTFANNINLFQLTYETEVNGKRYLFSHAGLMNSFYERNKDLIGEPTSENLNKLLDTKKGIEALCEVSYFRTRAWYADISGSIVWSDVGERIQNPSDGNVDRYDYQIFGHTIQEEGEPIVTDKWACLDCQKAFLLNENNSLIQLD